MSLSHTKAPKTLPFAVSDWYVSCSKGVVNILAEELNSLQLSDVRAIGSGVRFTGPLRDGYRVCMHSRVANRVLLPIHEGDASSPDALYKLIQEIDWAHHVTVDGTLAVDFFTAKSAITHSQFGALKVKDAVVDQFRDRFDRRPNVNRETPDLRINVYVHNNKARVAIDFSGTSLHRRGYRTTQGLAPIKENLAAALLLSAGWPNEVEQGHGLVDPMCGSGTLLIEAALIASQLAPGLYRKYFGFLGWLHHDATVWQSVKEEAEALSRRSPVTIVGADHDRQQVEQCRININNAGLDDIVQVEHKALDEGRPDATKNFSTGMVFTNPPYGERLTADDAFYRSLGRQLSAHYAGWRCALFTAETAAYTHAQLPLYSSLKVQNGAIDCVLLTGQVPTMSRVSSSNLPPPDEPNAAGLQSQVVSDLPTIDAQGFANRLKKNIKSLKGWVKQKQVNAYRVYDADLPEFALAIDIYQGQSMHCVVQEYRAPDTVNIAIAEARLDAALKVIASVFDISTSQLHLKRREVQSGSNQYQKRENAAPKVDMISEFGALLEVNFTDYLDTGLFLDHRPVRRFIKEHSDQKRFLNLFSYTASATVAACVGGAVASTSVDASNRYCQWARRNLKRNGASEISHQVIKSDVQSWLSNAVKSGQDGLQYDLILLDPPTFSNSTDLSQDWDVQRDHVSTIRDCLKLLAPSGKLVFSTNYRRFKFDSERVMQLGDVRVEDRTRWSIERDFQRNQKIHQCWFIYHSRVD